MVSNIMMLGGKRGEKRSACRSKVKHNVLCDTNTDSAGFHSNGICKCTRQRLLSSLQVLDQVELNASNLNPVTSSTRAVCKEASTRMLARI